MDLRKLRHAQVLGRFGSFVRAAEELHITQSALTRSVQLLESELGIKIFDRGPRGVRVTPVGRLFLDRAADILLAVRSLESDIGAAGRGEAGLVSFGLAPLPASTFLTALLTEVVRNHPRLRLAIQTNQALALLESLYAEDIEFCICSLALLPVPRKVVIRPIAKLSVAFYVRAQHPLITGKRIPLSTVLNYPLITGNVSGHALEVVREQSGLPVEEGLPISVSCDDFLVLKSVVLNTDAVWLTSSAAVLQERAAGTLVELDTTLESPSSTEIVAVSLAGRSLSPAAEWLLGRIREILARVGSVDGETRRHPPKRGVRIRTRNTS